MKYVIGIDGGGTKTLLKIATLDGNMVASLTGEATNLYAEKRDIVRVRLLKLIEEAVTSAGLSPDDCVALCMGAAGAVGETVENEILDMLSGFIPKNRILVTDDSQTAFQGGLERDSGILLISGTGSICCGKDSTGMACTVGGWGHICGDEGSGYSIGQAVLHKVFQALDGRGPQTLLTGLLQEQLAVTTPPQLVEQVYTHMTSKDRIAALALLCSKACCEGDRVAAGILDEAAVHLFLHVKAVVEKLPFFQDETLLAYSGSVLKKDAYLRERVIRLVKESYNFIEVMESKNDAAWGAVQMAIRWGQASNI